MKRQKQFNSPHIELYNNKLPSTHQEKLSQLQKEKAMALFAVPLKLEVQT